MADLEKMLAETKKTIRSLLLSVKEGQSSFMLGRDHKDLVGAPIPFKKLGFNSLEEMLGQMPDVCRKAYDPSGSEVYKAVADETTAHIADLVAHQKGKKPRSRKGAKFSSYNSRKPKSNYSFRPSQKYAPPSTSSYKYTRSKGTSQSTQYNRPRPQSYSSSAHPVYSSHRWPTGQSQGAPQYNNISTAASRTVTAATLRTNPQSTGKPDPNRKQTESEVRTCMEQVLSNYKTGVWLHLLCDIYLGMFGVVLPQSYLDLIQNWTDLVNPETMHGKTILYPVTAEQKSKTMTSSNGRSASTSSGDGDPLDFSGGIEAPDLFHVGEQCDVYISHVCPDMERVYVHRADSIVNDLMDEIAKHYSSATLKKYSRIPKNCICATKDSIYEAWNRATVVNTDGASKAHVFFLDFGNTETKSFDTLQPLSAQLRKPGAQAIPTALYNITSDNMELLAKEFESMTKDVPLTLVCQSTLDGACSVVLFDSPSCTSSINEKLVELGLARWEEPGLPVYYVGSQTKSKPAAAQTNGHQTSTSAAPIAKPSISPIRYPSPAKSTQSIPSTTRRESESSTHSSRSPVLPAEPGEHEIPEEDYWTVLVTHVLSSSTVYLRINSETPDFTKFTMEVASVYSGKKPMSLLDIGSLYVAHTFDEDGEGWHRVRAKELVDRNTVECEFVDYGSVNNVDRKNLYTITDEHRSIPYQTRLCVLYGLDQIEDDDELMITQLEEMTGTKTLIAQLIAIEQTIPQVVLFDTTGDDDIEINNEIGKLATHSRLMAKLPEPHQTVDVLLTYVERDGTFYVQKVGPSYVCLQELMADINEYYGKQKTTAQDFVSQPQVGDLVCAKYEGWWYRASIREILSDKKKVEVFFGDYGNLSTIPTSQLRKIPAEVEHAHTLPMQAIPCLLNGLPDWNDDVGAEAAQLIDSEKPYILMTIELATENRSALVQLSRNDLVVNNHLLSIYEASLSDLPDTTTATTTTTEEEEASHTSSVAVSKSSLDDQPHIPDDGAVVDTGTPGTPPGTPPDESLGQPTTHSTVLNESERETSAAGASSKLNSMSDLSHMGAGDYVAAKLHKLHLEEGKESEMACHTEFVSPPDVGQYWDVFVTTTNEPGHFVVVSLAQIADLNHLIDMLDAEYKGSEPVEGFSPVPGDLCAGLSSADSFWYRVLVLDGQVEDKVKVLFVDYGNYDYICKSHFRPLRYEYTSLELQAVRAGLYNLEPAVGNVWTNEAKADFIELCNEKRLVAIIKEVDRSKTLTSSGPSVWFELHDTNDNADINIDEELVLRGHAKYKEE